MRRPHETEVAAVIESDLRTALGTQGVTPAKLKAALIESVRTLQPPVQMQIDGDPNDPNQLLIAWSKLRP